MTDGQFTREIEAFAAEAAGALDMQISMPADIKPLVRAATAANPDPDAVRRATAFLSLVKRIAAAPPDDQQQCAAGCGRQLAGAVFSTVLVSPATPSPVSGLVLAVCTQCASARAQVRVKAREALRRVCFPDLRPIEIHPAAGRA